MNKLNTKDIIYHQKKIFKHNKIQIKTIYVCFIHLFIKKDVSARWINSGCVYWLCFDCERYITLCQNVCLDVSIKFNINWISDCLVSLK